MNKFEKLAKLEIAHQLIAQVHSDLCKEKERGDVIVETALDLVCEVLRFKSLLEMNINDDTETRIVNKTAHSLEMNIRNKLFILSEEGKNALTNDEIERIVTQEIKAIRRN